MQRQPNLHDCIAMKKFKTFIQDPWQEWDPGFCREIGVNTNRLTIWVPGLLCRNPLFDPSTPRIIGWEKTCRRIWRKHNISMAYAVLQFRHAPSKLSVMRPSKRVLTPDHWREARHLDVRLRHMIDSIVRVGGVDVMLFVEDFSARWALDTGLHPAVWAMDYPMVHRLEALESSYTSALTRPGIMRRPRVPTRQLCWEQLKLPFNASDLMAGHLPEYGTISFWSGDWCDRHIEYIPQALTRVVAERTHTYYTGRHVGPVVPDDVIRARRGPMPF